MGDSSNLLSNHRKVYGPAPPLLLISPSNSQQPVGAAEWFVNISFHSNKRLPGDLQLVYRPVQLRPNNTDKLNVST